MSSEYERQENDRPWNKTKRNRRGKKHQYTVYLNMDKVTELRKLGGVLSEVCDKAVIDAVNKLRKCPNCGSIRFEKHGDEYKCRNPSCMRYFPAEKIEGQN